MFSIQLLKKPKYYRGLEFFTLGSGGLSLKVDLLMKIRWEKCDGNLSFLIFLILNERRGCHEISALYELVHQEIKVFLSFIDGSDLHRH